MATYSRILLSGSTNGKPIVVTGTNSTGSNTLHTAVAGTASYDEIYFWAANVTATPATLTVEWGDKTSPPAGHMIEVYALPANSPPIPIATGQVLNNGLVASAYSGTASAINITGYVNRIV